MDNKTELFQPYDKKVPPQLFGIIQSQQHAITCLM